MYITLFLSGLSGGGAQRRMLLLAGGFAAHGHHVDLVVPRADGPYRSQIPEQARLVVLDAAWTRLPLIRHRRGLWVCASTLALARYLRHARPDVVLSTSNPANLTALWGRRRAQVDTAVVASVNVNPRAATGERQPPWAPPLRLLLRRCYHRADALIANSEGVAHDLAAVTGIPREQIRVIANPVPAGLIRARAGEPAAHPWFMPGQPPVLIGVGKLKRQKDFATLIRAFARLRRERVLRLVILGEGEERAALERLVQGLGVGADVLLPGFMDNPYAWMSRSAVFVSSSAWEGFSNVLCEALACGCPVVSTDCPSGSAQILQNGVYGSLVPVGDDAAMAAAIAALLHAAPERSRQQEAVSGFTVEHAVEGYLEVLSGVCRTHGAQRPAAPVAGHDAVTTVDRQQRGGAA